MERTERFLTDILRRLQQPRAQVYLQGLDFGVDGRDGFDRTTHARNIAYPL